MRKIYQNIKIDGVDVGENPKTADSAFFNENKWNTYIEPLLPKDCSEMTFIEFGCNAGLFLKLARKKGFEKVIGLEKVKRACKVAETYRGEDDYEIINTQVGEYFDCSDLPVADVVLMSNFHYHLHVSVLINLIDQLKYKTRYIILVSASEVGPKRDSAESDYGSVIRYFKGWKDARSIVGLPSHEDPIPREMWSILLKSPLERFDVKNLHRGNLIRTRFSISTSELAKMVINNDSITDLESLRYYKKLIARHTRPMSKEDALKQTKDKIKTFYDIKKNGIKEPLLINSGGKILNGGHRAAFDIEKGRKSMIVRIV